MRITPTDLYTFLRPAPCELRVYLTARQVEGLPPSPFAELLFKLGARHEAALLASFPDVLNLRGLSEPTRLDATQQAVADGVAVIYQGGLSAVASVGELEVEVYGEPDFLVRQGDGYAVMDAKLARRISRGDHPEIIASVQLYGWLYERVFGEPAAALGVYAGDGFLHEVEYDDGTLALTLLEEVAKAKAAAQEPYSPVGWSKCEPCPYSQRCWDPAIRRRDVAVLPSVDQGLARALHDQGINTIEELGASFTVEALAALKRPHGAKLAKVGRSAESILRHVDAWEAGRAVVFGRAAIPDVPCYVMFDIEGLPPFQNDLDRIYLWGFQAFGSRPGPYVGVAPGIGADGDAEVWEQFLTEASQLFSDYGDLPWVHWSHYERTNLKKYRDRYGDPTGTAERIEANLLDLWASTKSALALPVPSYGLKVIERFVGFQRSQSSYGGDWSIAQYIEAVECADDDRRQELLDEILTYNSEDLAATWAVFNWVRSELARATA